MIDFGALPPEINSMRMYAGPGPGSLTAAAVAWDDLATELHYAAAAYRSIISGLTVGRWLGPSSLTMASAFGPYVAWTAGAAARAAEAAGQARLAAEVYDAAWAATVPPQAVAANRVQLASLIATNFFGQNLPAIAANEAQYAEMWAQDAVAMYEYAANSALAAELTTFTAAPEVADASGVASQAAAVAQTAGSATEQFSLTSLMSAVSSMLQSLASPASASAAATTTPWGTLLGGLSSGTGGLSLSSFMSEFESNMPALLPGYLMVAVTPLYGLSSVLGMAQTLQGIATTASTAAVGAADAAAGAAADVAGAADALGAGVVGGLGQAASLGPLSVPASWTSVIPTAQLTSAGAVLPNVGGPGGLGNVPPSLLGGLPNAAAGRQAPGPRYGQIPTVMAQPPSGGYGAAII
jgi:PPE-repeat protein